MPDLNDEETLLVQTVRAFVDREVKPTVRDVEHANTYPHDWIEQMKRIGIFGLAISERHGGSGVDALLRRGDAGAGSRLDEPGGAMGGHTVVAKLLETFGTDEQKQAYLPRMATRGTAAHHGAHEPGADRIYQASPPLPSATAMSG